MAGPAELERYKEGKANLDGTRKALQLAIEAYTMLLKEAENSDLAKAMLTTFINNVDLKMHVGNITSGVFTQPELKAMVEAVQAAKTGGNTGSTTAASQNQPTVEEEPVNDSQPSGIPNSEAPMPKQATNKSTDSQAKSKKATSNNNPPATPKPNRSSAQPASTPSRRIDFLAAMQTPPRGQISLSGGKRKRFETDASDSPKKPASNKKAKP